MDTQVLYASMNADQAAAALNLVRTGQAGATPQIRVRRRDITGVELLEAIDIRDLTIPGAINPTLAGSYLESVLQQPRIEIGNDGDTNGSQSRLNALRFRFLSRAEQLGLGRVEPGHVIEARAFGG